MPLNAAVVDLRQLARSTNPCINIPKHYIELRNGLTTRKWTVFDVLKADSKRLHRLTDFVVLGATFYTFCLLFSVELGDSLLVHIFAYSTLLLACVRLSKRAIANYYKSVSECTRQILGNAIGILIGTSIMLLFETLLSNHSAIVVPVALSSVMAFFVLGTFCPLAHKTSSRQK